jgi:phosphocarrier protein
MSLLEKEVEIINQLGLHARAAAKFVSTAGQFSAEVYLGKDHQKINGKSIMGVMMLAASKGTLLKLSTEGEDEQQAMEALTNLIRDRFGEAQ